MSTILMNNSCEATLNEYVNEDCQHSQTVTKNGLEICEECGMELYQEISSEQEWRFYGEKDTKNNSDPSRCQYRKSPEKGIQKELEKLGFPSDIATEADKLYMKVTQGEIKRSNLRKGITFACLFEAYRLKNRHRVPEELRLKLDITKKCMSKGITFYRLKCDKKEVSTDTIMPKHYIPGVMERFNIKQEHINNVLKLAEIILTKSSTILNRSSPENIATSLVYYYLRSVGSDIDISQYSKIVGISETIINKLNDEIQRLS
jgi:transcription initiation factor TFIIIB Brf1 subunit/transcription initiation factor TFIIB